MSLKALDLLAGLTPKQRRFLQEYRGVGDGSRAARAAGYSSKRANTAAWYILKGSPKVQEIMNEVMDEVGLDTGAVWRGIIEGLNAEVVKTATHEGQITDEKSYPDYQVRHKYLETLIKLRDMFPADKLDVNDNRKPLTDQEFREQVKQLNQMIRDDVKGD